MKLISFNTVSVYRNQHRFANSEDEEKFNVYQLENVINNHNSYEIYLMRRN